MVILKCFGKTAASRPPKQLLQPSRGRCNTTLHSIILFTRTSSLCFFSQAVLKTAALLPLLQPAMRGQPSSTWAASSFLSSFLHIHPSSCFLSPRSFRSLVPAVLLFGLILQLHNFKLFFCALAEERLIHLCSSSHPSLLLFPVFVSVWEPPGEAGSNQQNQNYPQNVQMSVQPTCSDPNGDVSPARSEGGDAFLKPSRLVGWGMREDGRGYSTCGAFGDLSSPA